MITNNQNDRFEKYLWVFGTAVQDVTAEVDLDRLEHEHPNLQDYIRLEQMPYVKHGIWFITNAGTKRYAVQMRFEDETPIDGYYNLTPGAKYGHTTSPNEASRVVRMCGLIPIKTDVTSTLVELGRLAAQGEQPWHAYALGRAYHRAGDFSSAIKWLTKAYSLASEERTPGNFAVCSLDLAIAYHHLGDPDSQRFLVVLIPDPHAIPCNNVFVSIHNARGHDISSIGQEFDSPHIDGHPSTIWHELEYAPYQKKRIIIQVYAEGDPIVKDELMISRIRCLNIICL